MNTKTETINSELLAVLKVFVERADWCEKSDIPGQRAAVEVFRDRIEAARAAVAKAERLLVAQADAAIWKAERSADWQREQQRRDEAGGA